MGEHSIECSEDLVAENKKLREQIDGMNKLLAEMSIKVVQASQLIDDQARQIIELSDELLKFRRMWNDMREINSRIPAIN